MLRNLGGGYARGDTLYTFIQERWGLVHAPTPGMSAHDSMKGSMRNDLRATCNGQELTRFCTEKKILHLFTPDSPRTFVCNSGIMDAVHYAKPAIT